MTLRRITEAEAERIADRRVQTLLATDMAYKYAPNAECQAAREEKISEDVWASIEREYEIA